MCGYETFGTKKLANAAIKALVKFRNACLLANHGLISINDNLSVLMILSLN